MSWTNLLVWGYLGVAILVCVVGFGIKCRDRTNPPLVWLLSGLMIAACWPLFLVAYMVFMALVTLVVMRGPSEPLPPIPQARQDSAAPPASDAIPADVQGRDRL
jgi:hypothetical protein